MGRNLDPEILKKIPESTHTPADIIHHLMESIYDEDLTDQDMMKNFYVN